MNFQVCLQKRGHSKSSDLVEIRSVKEVSEPLGKAERYGGSGLVCRVWHVFWVGTSLANVCVLN